jgi:hypothetical protein
MRKLAIITIFLVVFLTQYAIRYTLYAEQEDYIVATVGEEKIYFSEIEKVAQGLNRFLKENFQTSREWRLNYIRQYVARVALTKRAEREEKDKSEDVLFALEQARRNILSDKLLGDRLAKIKITEDDLKRYYEQNKSKYRIRERIKLSYIKLKTKREAERIIARLNKGRGFKKVAGKKIVKINDWISKDMPFVPGLENIKPQVWKKLFALGVGGTSEIIIVDSVERITESEKAKSEKLNAIRYPLNAEYYIFHIDEREPAKDRPFEEVRRQVEFEYSKKVRDEAINEFIMETFAQEKVKIYEDRIVEEMQR